MRALIVDDDAIGRKVMQKLLSPYGECDAVGDGLEALNAFIVASTEERAYDAIFLDIVMPILGGHETLRLIRQLEDKYGIPAKNRVKIIMTTGVSDRDHIVQAVQDKCSAYMVKPIQEGQVLEKLMSLGLIDEDVDDGE